MGTAAPYRTDLTGLRTIAVLLVVLFHADIPGLEAGFIGVDVFFVLSGFLITSSLLAQVEANGRIDLKEFWAARARRLLPAASLAISVTVVFSMLILSPFVWRDRLIDAWAASSYWANFRFGSADQSYFGASTGESPFLHFWSLSIEEQTYLALPLLMTLVVMRSGREGRSSIVRLLWVMLVGSLAISALTTQLDRTPMTYFNTTTRVWEIAAGALLAAYLPAAQRLVRRLSPTVVRALGLATLTLSVAFIQPFGVFPGVVAVAPVVGALLMIAAVGGRVGPLDHPVSLWIGERSYAWYLWHWPVIVLGEAALERWVGVAPSWPIATMLAFAALVPTAASYRWVEQPLRTSVRLRSTARNTVYGIGSVVFASLAVIALAGGIATWRLGEPELLALDDARTDYPPLPAVCSTMDVSELLAECAAGPRVDGTERILLLGDSHVGNWAPAFVPAGTAAGYQVVSALGGSCPIIGDGITFDTWWCEEMRAGLWAAVDNLDPSIVVLGHSGSYASALVDENGDPVPPGQGLATWSGALLDVVEQLRERDIEVVLVQPTPSNEEHPIMCASLGREHKECVGTRAELAASVAEVADTQREVLAGIEGVSIFDPLSVVCPSVVCLFEENGNYVWNDAHHVTKAFAATKVDVVAPFFTR